MSVANTISTYGWDYAKGMVRDNPKSDLIFMIKLKEYVEAYELVESYGGVSSAKKYLDSEYRKISTPETYLALEQSLSLVEECL